MKLLSLMEVVSLIGPYPAEHIEDSSEYLGQPAGGRVPPTNRPHSDIGKNIYSYGLQFWLT